MPRPSLATLHKTLPRGPIIAGIAVVALFAGRAAARAEDAPAADKATPGAAKSAEAAALFKQLDANADGALAVNEVPTDKQGLVRRLLRNGDSDKDGKLSHDEFVAAMQVPRRERGGNGAARGERGVMALEPDAFFSRFDKNGDGKVTPDEMPEERRERFTALLTYADTNSDGGIEREEFAKMRERAAGGQTGRPGQQNSARQNPAQGGQQTSNGQADSAAAYEAVFKTLDKNGDGKLSSDEIRNASDSLAGLDKDGDGSITVAELGRTRPRALAGLGGGGANADPARVWQRLIANDKNKDGKLSEDEMPERLQQAFSRLDQNGDGYVDETEFKTGLERLRSALSRQP